MARVTEAVLSWPGVSKHPERFGGNAFRFHNAEIGHVHQHGTVHIPFPNPLHDELLAQGLAETHQYAPDRMVSFQIRDEAGFKYALWLMQLSYVRSALKQAPAPARMLEEESERLGLSPRLRELMQPFASATPVSPPLPQTNIRNEIL